MLLLVLSLRRIQVLETSKLRSWSKVLTDKRFNNERVAFLDVEVDQEYRVKLPRKAICYELHFNKIIIQPDETVTIRFYISIERFCPGLSDIILMRGYPSLGLWIVFHHFYNINFPSLLQYIIH